MFVAKGFLAQLVSDKTAGATVIQNLGNVVIPIFKIKAGAPSISTSASGTNSPVVGDLAWISQYVDEPRYVGGGVSIANEGYAAIPEDKYARAVNALLSIAPVTVTFKFDTTQYGQCYLRLINDSGYYLVTSNTIITTFGTQSMNACTPDGVTYGSIGITLYVKHYSSSNGITLDTNFFIVQDMSSDGTLPDSNTWFAIAHASATSSLSASGTYNIRRFTGTTATFFNTFWNMVTNKPQEQEDPFENLPVGGDEPLPGGGGVTEPGFPSISAASTGIIGLFVPSVAQMQQLADFMWTDFGGQATDIKEVLEEILEAIKRTISNPLDYIFGLNIVPSQGLTVGASKVVKFGYISSGVSMPILADHYFRVDCGSLSFDTVCGDSFLDYAPYAKFSIYLPYIGFKDVDPNDFVGHTISVVYHGDAITGGLTAYVLKDGEVYYQYSGGCVLNVPLSADSWGETIAACMNIATGIAGGASTGGLVGGVTQGLKGIASNLSSLSPKVMHSGAISGSPACMGVQYPFVIREAVNFHSTAGFNKSSGYPAYYYKKLDDVQGFTVVIDAHLENIPMATQNEISEIESLLESGVIL